MAKQTQRKVKHVPMRTCVACREKIDKRQLTRIVRTPVGEDNGVTAGVVVDPTGKRNGRGAYLCTKPSCWERAVKRRILDSALKIDLTETEREMLLAVSAEMQSAQIVQVATPTHV